MESMRVAMDNLERFNNGSEDTIKGNVKYGRQLDCSDSDWMNYIEGFEDVMLSLTDAGIHVDLARYDTLSDDTMIDWVEDLGKINRYIKVYVRSFNCLLNGDAVNIMGINGVEVAHLNLGNIIERYRAMIADWDARQAEREEAERLNVTSADGYMEFVGANA